MNAATAPASGLALIEAEMRRQHADALASFAGAELSAARIAKSARLTGRLLLIGMGGSHFVNRVAEPVYRALGLDAPAFYHCELVLDKSGARLAKRHDSLSLRALREQGISPEQIRQQWQQG